MGLRYQKYFSQGDHFVVVKFVLFCRCPLKTLQKCEIALEKLKNDMAVVCNAVNCQEINS